MYDSIGDPGQHIEDWMACTSQNIRDVGAVPYGLEGGKYRYPDMWTGGRCQKSRRVVEEKPEKNRRSRHEEL